MIDWTRLGFRSDILLLHLDYFSKLSSFFLCKLLFFSLFVMWISFLRILSLSKRLLPPFSCLGPFVALDLYLGLRFQSPPLRFHAHHDFFYSFRSDQLLMTPLVCWENRLLTESYINLILCLILEFNALYSIEQDFDPRN